MGVQGLLQLLKSIQKPCHIKDFSHMTLGVDAYGWLHPGTIPCAVALALDKPTTKYVDYAMHRVRMLLHYGITPYIVFDGNYLPSKAGTELKREAKRADAKRKGLELLKMGKTTEAHSELQKAIDVTPEMARSFVERLKQLKVRYVVAPYEADAQLAYMERQGIINGIISEDSDLLVFGAKRLVTKLDRYGECIEINRDNFTGCKAVSLAGWTDDMFRRMAILAGCDYLEGLQGMGLKTAHGFVRRYKEVEPVIRALQFEGKRRLPPAYLQNFQQAEQTFLYQWVFDPVQQKLVMSREWEPTTRPENISFLGDDLETDIAIGVANGDLHPMTRLPLKILPSSPKAWKYNKDHRGSWQRRETVTTPSDLKSHKKPIDAFFKPQRTPLAELDPNLFRPSPIQQDLLRRHSGTLISTSVDENNHQVHLSTTTPAIQSTGALRTHRTSIGQESRVRSEPNPFKRQRLCDDNVEKRNHEDQTAEKTISSKFFSSRAPDLSPSLQRCGRRKDKTSDFDVLADESMDSLMSHLNSDSKLLQPGTPKLAVFKEAVEAAEKAAFSKFGKGDTHTSDTSTAPSSSASGANTKSSRTNASIIPASPPKQNRSSKAAPVDLEDARKGSRFRECVPTAPSGKRWSSTTSATASNPLSKPQMFRRESSLARLGRQALERSQSSSTSAVATSASESSSSRSTQETQRLSQDTPSLPHWSFGSRPARIAALAEEDAVGGVAQGSEDLIVPNSEEESAGEEEEIPQKASAINLERFAFSG